MSTKDRNDSSTGKDTARRGPVSRRALLRGAATAMPAVLTLHSGAALARSSNLINAASNPPPDALGRTLCVDLRSVNPVDGSNVQFDMGEPPHANLNAIHDRDHRLWAKRTATTVSEQQMCKDGGSYYFWDDSGTWTFDSATGSYVNGKWVEVKVPRGFLVSATAVTSMASAIDIYDM